MKKSTAIFLAVCLLIQLLMPSVSAGIPSDPQYTIIDTCYSPALNRYVAVAKDMKAGTHPVELLYSDDGASWTRGRSIGTGIHYANKETHQTVVWYEKANLFITQMDKNVLTSPDGVTWTLDNHLGGEGKSNSVIETNGEQLIINTRKTLRVYDDITADPVVEQVYEPTNNDLYGKAVGGTSTEPYKYLVADQGMAYVMTPNGAGGANWSGIVVPSGTFKGMPTEMVYDANLEKWLIADGKATGLISFDVATDTFAVLTDLSMADGSTISPVVSAVAVSDAYIVLGTSDGKVYIAENTSDALKENSGSWCEVEPRGSTKAIAEAIQSMTIVDDIVLFATGREFYEASQDSMGWGYHATDSENVIIDGAERIEIPETGELVEEYTVQSMTWDGEPSEDAVASVSLVGNAPSGITAQTTADGIRLTVDSSVEGGHSLKIRVQLDSGYTTDKDVTIVDEASVNLSGVPEMIVPIIGEPANRYEYVAEVVGTDGNPMETRAADITVEPAELPEGITLQTDSAGKATLVIASNAKNTTVVITAAAKREQAQMRVALSERRVNSIEITAGAEKLVIPDEKVLQESYAAIIYDQAEGEMKTEDIAWSVAAKEISTMEGIAIDEKTGVLSVEAKAFAGVVTVKAASVSTNSVFKEMDVALSFTDLRIVQEDLMDVNFDTSILVEDDFELIQSGACGSKITWRSSDTNLLKDDGTVIRPSREDKKVTLTCTATSGKTARSKEFTFTIKKADNLCANGDFAENSTAGWVKKSDDSSLIIKQEGDKNVLSVTGGAYHAFTFTNDSSYAFELTVKADAGKTMKLSSLVGGTIAETEGNGAYQTVKGSLDYRKQRDVFVDKLIVECDVVEVSAVRVYEITLELNAVSAAVSKAEYSKKKEDVDAAKKLLESFYDLPVKETLQNKLDKIDTSTNTGGNKKPTGGGGGGGGGSFKSPTVAGNTQGSAIVPPESTENNDADELDTYLLTFKDMKQHWAREDVEYMASLNLINGTEPGTFSPDNTITRAEFAALVVRAMGFAEAEYENSFLDVVKEDWYSGYAQTAKDKGIMTGYNGLFTPNAPISREEIAKVIVGAYHSKAGGSPEQGKALYFNDLADISFWAYDSIAEAVNLGFMNGLSEETFSPKSNATRAQAAVLLRRVYDKLNAAQ